MLINGKELTIARGANLRGSDLCGANLRDANLRDADLCGANLRDANLRDADLCGSDLCGSDLRDADLRDADLCGSDLRGSDLRRADLRRADLRGSDLCGSDLCDADLRGVKIDKKQSDMFSIVPETGAFEGWKKCRDGVIVRLLIQAKAMRSNATSRKCRASAVRVLDVIGAKEGISTHDWKTKYVKGKVLRVKDFDQDRWNECSTGIHFYLTRSEAEAY